MKNNRVTLAQIAREVGLHVSTVSRVLNSSGTRAADAASGANAEFIRATANRLGYRPNTLAQGLRTNRTMFIGVMVPRLTDYVLAEIYEGIQTEASERNLMTLVTNSQDKGELQHHGIRMMGDRGVDGYILGDVPISGGYARELAQVDVPFVLVSRSCHDYPSVTGDDYLGGQLMARHFLELGHKCVGVVTGLSFASTGLDRSRGFCDEMASAGLAVAAEYREPSGFTVESGYRATSNLLSRAPEITAIFVVNDFDAIGACGAIRESGRKVGRDIAVGGYNNLPLTPNMSIPLTTIDSPRIEMGRQALAMLTDIIAGGAGSQVKLETRLVARESTLGVRLHGA